MFNRNYLQTSHVRVEPRRRWRRRWCRHCVSNGPLRPYQAILSLENSILPQAWELTVEKFQLSTVADPKSTVSLRVQCKVDCWSWGLIEGRQFQVDVFSEKSKVGQTRRVADDGAGVGWAGVCDTRRARSVHGGQAAEVLRAGAAHTTTQNMFHFDRETLTGHAVTIRLHATAQEGCVYMTIRR
eukprot:1178660-Prorocentrum_minimum.AAC.1